MGYSLTVRRKEIVDTEEIAGEIVDLKNRMGELDPDSPEWGRLHHRLRVLQDRLATGTTDEKDPESPGNEVQYVPPL